MLRDRERALSTGVDKEARTAPERSKQPPECTSVTGLRHNRQSLRPYRMGLKRAT